MASLEELAIAKQTQQFAPSKVEIDAVDYDFGFMNPMQTGRHAFVVRNAGERDLELKVVNTTCKCTVGEVGSQAVPPGGETTVTLEWNTASKVGHYAHGAWVNTNDPDRKQFFLRVMGRVQSVAGLSSDTVVFNNLRRSQASTETVIAFSPTWKEMTIENIQCSLPDATWTVEPATADELENVGGTTGYRVSVTVPESLPTGAFRGLLTCDLVPGPEEQKKDFRSIPCQLYFSGKVPALMTLAGKDYQVDQGLHLGNLSRGQAYEAELFLLVRQPDKEVRFVEVTSTSDFLSVQVLADGRTSHGTQRFKVRVNVPQDIPLVSHLGDDAVVVQLVADQPGLPVVRFPVQFAMTEPGDS